MNAPVYKSVLLVVRHVYDSDEAARSRCLLTVKSAP